MSAPKPSPMRLHDIAHARTGDKGNHSNISCYAYRSEDYELLVAQVTEERVADLFAACREKLTEASSSSGTPRRSF